MGFDDDVWFAYEKFQRFYQGGHFSARVPREVCEPTALSFFYKTRQEMNFRKRVGERSYIFTCACLSWTLLIWAVTLYMLFSSEDGPEVVAGSFLHLVGLWFLVAFPLAIMAIATLKHKQEKV